MKTAPLLIAACAACGADPLVTPETPPPATFTDLHQTVIQRTCSPNRGVCHNSASYPDLSTAANVLHLLRAPCNVELPQPEQGWNACERPADRVVAGDFASDIAWSTRVDRGVFRFGLRDAATITATRTASFVDAFDLALGPDRAAAWIQIALQRGSRTGTVSIESVALREQYRETYDRALARIVPGDPNRDGIFGAELGEHASILEPRDLDRSYLWRRLVGTVPGTRMPLANQPLSAAEYVGIACFIEGLDERTSADSAIDYESCTSAQLPFGELVADFTPPP